MNDILGHKNLKKAYTKLVHRTVYPTTLAANVFTCHIKLHLYRIVL